MFKYVTKATGEKLTIWFNDEPIRVRENENVAAALLQAGKITTRICKENIPHGPYCMMGVCFECLVKIDGKPNQQACMHRVHEGMVIHSMDGLRPFLPCPLLRTEK